MNTSQGARQVAGVHYREDNPGSKEPPIVLLHGVGDDLTSWDEVVARLPSDRSIIRYDLRGHGHSPSPAGPWTIDDFVADHVQLLTRLNAGTTDTVGFSLGGLIAQRLAVEYPGLVRRLVVIGAVAGRTEIESAAVLRRLELVQRHGPTRTAGESVERWFSAGYLKRHPEVVTDTVDRIARLDPRAYADAYRVLATTDLADDLHRIQAPTLALTGEYDVGSPPRMAETIAHNVAEGQVRILPGVRHSVLKECPEIVAKELIEHVR